MKGGFTLVELVIVVALLAGLALLGVPFGVDTYRDYVLISTTRDMVSLLRRAETFALANASSSSYGVSFRTDRAVLFKGATYAGRDAAFDEEHVLSPSVVVNATGDVIFAALSGMPGASTAVTVGNGFRSQGIDVNTHGVISW